MGYIGYCDQPVTWGEIFCPQHGAEVGGREDLAAAADAGYDFVHSPDDGDDGFTSTHLASDNSKYALCGTPIEYGWGFQGGYPPLCEDCDEEWDKRHQAAQDTLDGEIETIRQGFEFELCHTCGRDYEDHEIGVDPLGHAHAVCRFPPLDPGHDPDPAAGQGQAAPTTATSAPADPAPTPAEVTSHDSAKRYAAATVKAPDRPAS